MPGFVGLLLAARCLLPASEALSVKMAATSKVTPGPWAPAAAEGDNPGAAKRILVVDDERSLRELLAIVLRREGYEVLLAENGEAALAALGRGAVDLLISDIKMPDMSGVDVLRAAKAADAGLPAIMMTAFASTETAVEAMRLGACDYLVKPFDVDELKLKVREKLEARELRQENVLLKRALNKSHVFAGIIGRSAPMLAVFDLVESVAKTTSTVLITGESGTGKELVARALHFHSLRRERPFVALNCGALTETLLESELFGHMRGAFTGAEMTKKGLVEIAEGGTIFLDEIGEMTPMMQVKLLRVLQERRFRRVGGLEEIEANIRVVAATNQDLPKLVAEGKFREDLYYRINVIPIQLPPLRERREDIPLIAEHFLAKYREQMGKTVTGISGEAMAMLEAYRWPGNIRELENVIERAVALERSPTVLAESLSPQIRARMEGPVAARSEDAGVLPATGFDLEQHVQDVERRYLAQALERAGGVQVRAAELLGMSFRSFRYYAKKYNLK
jgi:two-component system, NtrC family, response regulator PilR